MYAECDAYGVKLTARSNFATLVVKEYTPIPGNASHGYITEPELTNLNTVVNPNFKFEEGKTDYTIYSLDNNVSGSFYCQAPLGKSLWYGVRTNGIKQSTSLLGDQGDRCYPLQSHRCFSA